MGASRWKLHTHTSSWHRTGCTAKMYRKLSKEVKGTQTGVLDLGIYRRSYSETGKRSRDTEKAGPSTQFQWLRSWRVSQLQSAPWVE